jgi:dolichol kinase
MNNKKEISYRQELLRKGIHLCSLSIPIGYALTNKELALSILLPLTIIIVLFDILSQKISFVGKMIIFFFGAMLREHELKNDRLTLNGASWVMISSILTIVIFPKMIAVTGFAILIISDTTAALYGRKFGKTPFFNKSVEGSSAFAISAVFVVLISSYLNEMPLLFYIFSIIGAIVSTLVEAASSYLKIDDNLTIPISFGIVVWVGGVISAFIGYPFL